MNNAPVPLDASALANLDALAGAASRGPWECREADGLAAILTQDGWLEDCSAEQEVANARFTAGANPAVVRALVAIAQRAAQLEAALKPWTAVQDAIPERMPDGRQFSREVLVCDRSRGTAPRMARVHYYDNQPPVWEGGDPTHWCDLPDLPNDENSTPAVVRGAGADVREADRALKSIRRVIEQDTAREGERATLALFLDDDVNTLQKFVNANREGAPVASPRAAVIMPRNISEKTMLAAATALRAALCKMTGSDGHVAKKIFEAVYVQLADVDHEGPVLGTAEHVHLPAELDDDLWRAGMEAFRESLNRRTGLDMFVAKQTYEGMYAHLAARQAQKK